MNVKVELPAELAESIRKDFFCHGRLFNEFYAAVLVAETVGETTTIDISQECAEYLEDFPVFDYHDGEENDRVCAAIKLALAEHRKAL